MTSDTDVVNPWCEISADTCTYEPNRIGIVPPKGVSGYENQKHPIRPVSSS